MMELVNLIVPSLFNVSANPNKEPDIDATTASNVEVPPACNAESTQINEVVDEFNLSTLNISTQESMKNCFEQLIESANSSTIAGTYTIL